MLLFVFFFKQKTAYEMRISDWSSDVCSSDLNFDFRKHMPSLVFTLVAVAFIAGAGAITVYLGLYNIAADAPHSRMTYSVMETFRERSIAARSGSIAVPTDLAAPARIASGAGL